MVDETVGGAGVGEAHLRLGRRDVDVHGAPSARQEEEHRRVPVGPDRVARGLPDRAGERAVLDRPPVDEKVLVRREANVTEPRVANPVSRSGPDRASNSTRSPRVSRPKT